MPVLEQLRFLSEFALRPRVIGAVCPSSQRLARTMVEWIDWSNVRAVVEYGPGTGVFTRQILSQTRPDARVVASELNPTFVTSLQTRYPDVRLYQDSVANVKAICRNEEIQEVDAIVSGLPWASFSGALQLELLRATTSVLKPGGQFVTFAYLQGLLLKSGRGFRRQLRDHFSRVERSRTVWMNLPPAFVYRCRR